MRTSLPGWLLLAVVLATSCGSQNTDPHTTVQEIQQNRFSPVYQLPTDTLAKAYLGVISEYSQVKQALADGNSQLAQQRARTLQAAVEQFLTAAPKDTTARSQTLRKHGNELRLTALAISQTGLLSEQRAHFYGMSQYLLRFVEDFGTAGLFLRQYTNPAGPQGRPAYWFEADSLPEDPYGTPGGAQASLTGIYKSE